MKGKRHATEQKIRILRGADGGKSIVEVCKEHNISEVTFRRWKRQFHQLDVNEAKRMNELERENAELKKMLADAARHDLRRVARPDRKQPHVSDEDRRRPHGPVLTGLIVRRRLRAEPAAPIGLRRVRARVDD